MAIESLIVLGLATLVLLIISIYANKHRTKNSRVTKKTIGVEGFINDECVEQKNINRYDFAKLVKEGKAKSNDASMFHGLATNSKVEHRCDEY
jgi:hypothetical protein